MVIKNLTRKTVISKSAKEAKSIRDKIFGLIFEKKTSALILNTRFGIHTHLMNKSIDVLVLDKSKRVVRLKEDLKPDQIFLWNPRYSKIIEVPKGIIAKTKTKVGDKLELKES